LSLREGVVMPAPYPREFRDDVVAVARRREPGVTLKQIAGDFGIAEASLTNWLKQSDTEDGRKPGQTKDEAAEVRSCGAAIGCWSRRTRC
jgi:transposase-like protein